MGNWESMNSMWAASLGIRLILWETLNVSKVKAWDCAGYSLLCFWLRYLSSSVSASIISSSFLISFSIWLSNWVFGILPSAGAFTSLTPLIYFPALSTRLIILPLYVLMRTSILPGVAIHPISTPVIDSGILHSNRSIGYGDLWS